ncbi:MAG: hypothetical protein HY843_09090 [Bdellovibrio sp.]|nr:hypothetical protein [Bdellovibrio sp.]
MNNCIYHPKSPLNWNWLEFSGPDTQDFLQRLTSIDVKNLTPCEGRPGFFLNAHGKIQAYFTLWFIKSNEYAFEFNAGSGSIWKQKLLRLIDQYTFSEKFCLNETNQNLFAPTWILLNSEKILTLNTYRTKTLPHGLRLNNHGTQSFDLYWYTLWGAFSEKQKWLNQTFLSNSVPQEITLETIEKLRIAHMTPCVDHEITENTIPLEIGLKMHIADNKGCYPGQEVIERITSLGSPSRRLIQIEGTGLLPFPGEKILNLLDNIEIGEVTSVMRENGKFLALGIVKKLFANHGTSVKLQNGSNAIILKVSSYV